MDFVFVDEDSFGFSALFNGVFGFSCFKGDTLPSPMGPSIGFIGLFFRNFGIDCFVGDFDIDCSNRNFECFLLFFGYDHLNFNL